MDDRTREKPKLTRCSDRDFWEYPGSTAPARIPSSESNRSGEQSLEVPSGSQGPVQGAAAASSSHLKEEASSSEDSPPAASKPKPKEPPRARQRLRKKNRRNPSHDWAGSLARKLCRSISIKSTIENPRCWIYCQPTHCPCIPPSKP